MSFIVRVKSDSTNNGKGFAPIRPGMNLMKWVGIVNLGTHKNTFPNATKPVITRIYLLFITKNGNFVSKTVSNSFHPKSFLSNLVETVMHCSYEEVVNKEISIGELLKKGMFLYGNISPIERNGKTVAKLVSISPAGEDEKFESRIPVFAVDIEEAVNDLSVLPYGWMKETVKQSTEWIKKHPKPIEQVEKEVEEKYPENHEKEEQDESSKDDNNKENVEENNNNRDGEDDGEEDLKENENDADDEDDMVDPLLGGNPLDEDDSQYKDDDEDDNDE